jgi:hypothetical protein
MSTQPPHDPTPPLEPLRIDLSLEGQDGERWRVRVGLRPTGDPVHIDGATVAFNDGTGRPLGPAVVLPVAGEIADYVELHARVQGPATMRAGTQLRCTTFFSSGRDPQVAEEGVAPRRGFLAWLRGECALELPPAPEGRALSDDELDVLREAWPGLFEGDVGDDPAFAVFEEDLLSSMELGEHDSVTEEILRMLRED